MLPPTDENEVRELIHRMESHYRNAFLGFDEDEMFYDGRLDDFIVPPEGFDMIIPTTARAVVDEAVDNITPADILVHYAPRGKGRQPEVDADSVRRWVRALWSHWRSSSNDIDIIRDFEKCLFMSGQGCFKLVMDKTLWPELASDVEAELLAEGGKPAVIERVKEIENLRKENTPILCKSIPPSNLMFDPSVGGRKLWVIERYESLPEEVLATYEMDIAELRGLGYYHTEWTVHEVWTASYLMPSGRMSRGKHWVFVNYAMVLEEDNIFGGLPYVTKYSGFGRETYNGKPENKAVGFFTRQNKSMMLAEARRHMQFDAIMSQVAFPVAFMDESEHETEMDFSPGSVNYISSTAMSNIDKLWVKAPIPDAEYLSSLGAIASQIERGTVQRALRGAGVPGTDSAAQLGMIGSQARLRVDSAKMATEDAMAEITALALKVVDTLYSGKVSVFGFEDANVTGYTLGASQIKGHYRCKIEFKPNEDSVKERKLILANEAISKGGLSRYDALTFAGFEAPWDLIERKDADDIMQEPLIKRALARDVLKGWGVDVTALELEESEEQARKQLQLNDLQARMLNGGTMAGGDPMSPDGNPANAQLTPPALGASQQPSVGGDMGAGLPLPGGAPAGLEAGPVAGMMRDMNALSAGVQ